MILGLRSTIYPVQDLTVARNWYAKVLGQEPYFEEVFYVGFSVGGFELGLIPDGTADISGSQALWGVHNADESLAKLIQSGATLLEAVNDVGGGIRIAAVRDPFGNRFGIIQNPHFDPTQIR